MRWPIRNQILIPFGGIQVLTLTVLTAVFAWRSVKEVEQETLERLARVLTTLEDAAFPLTQNVLDQLHLLSGADFVVVNADGAAVTATIAHADADAVATSSIPSAPLAEGFSGRRSMVQIGGERFFAGNVRSPTAARRSVVVLYPERRWLLARWNAIYPPLAIGAVALCFTMAASTLIARRMSQRIRNVQDQVARIAGGRFERISIPQVDDELSDLAHDVNRMCAALENAAKQTRETERANLISQLAGGLSHQLRNAITGARMSVQLHVRHCDRRQDEALDVALKQLRLTEEQIKGLLRLTRGETRTFAPGSVDEILTETVSLVQPICRHNRIALETEIPSMEGRVEDSDAIRGAVLNLIMNAIDAAGPQGRVAVSARREDSQVVLDVSDDGPGVSDEVAGQIFDPFVSTKPEGIGLGLALVRKTASDFGGKLSMFRRHDMTTFRFTFHANTDQTS